MTEMIRDEAFEESKTDWLKYTQAAWEASIGFSTLCSISISLPCQRQL